MTGTIVAAFVFGSFIFWMSDYLGNTAQTSISSTFVAVVAISVFLAGFMFILCGISDYRLMRDTLKQEEEEQQFNAH